MYDHIIIKGMVEEVIDALNLKSKEGVNLKSKDKVLVKDVFSKYCKTYVIEERL